MSRLVAWLRSLAASRTVKFAFFVGAVALGVVAIQRSWDEFVLGLGQLSPPVVLGCVLAIGAALVASTGSLWVLLRTLGAPIAFPAALRILLVGQVGKYIPGFVWSIVGPAEVGRSVGVPRRTTVSSVLLSLVFAVTTGLLVASVTVPFAPSGSDRRFLGLLALVPLLIVALLPPVLNRVIQRLLRIAGQPHREVSITWRGVSKAAGCSLLTWLGYGISVALLCSSAGVTPGPAMLLGTGGFALAWAAGFLVVFAPAGVGVREAVLVATLAPVLDSGHALAIALVHRVLVSAVELVMALGGLWVTRRLVVQPDG